MNVAQPTPSAEAVVVVLCDLRPFYGDMPRRSPNQRGGIGPMSGDHVRWLNEQSPGLGNYFAQAFADIGGRVDATYGKHGSVVMRPQTRRDARGLVEPTSDYQGGRIANVADPVDGKDPVTLDYFRRFTECERLLDKLQECMEEDELTGGGSGGGEIPWFWGYTVHPPNPADTFLNDPGAFVPNSGGVPDEGYFVTWSFILQASAGVSFLTWFFGTDAPVFVDPAVRKFNVGLYNNSRELKWQFGPETLDGLTSGVNTRNIGGQTFASGEYYLAYFSPACHKIWSFETEVTTTDIMNRGVDPGNGNPPKKRQAYAYRIPSASNPVFPATLPSQGYFTTDSIVTIRVPLFFFSED